MHPGRWPPARGRAVRRRTAPGWPPGSAPSPAPLAAAGRGGVAVLDVGATGAEATLLAADGTVGVVAAAEVGGRLLDELVAARTGRGADRGDASVREALSLLPTVDGVGAPRPCWRGAHRAARGRGRRRCARCWPGPAARPVLLIGGVARTPLLAGCSTRRGSPPQRWPRSPDGAAVLGALAERAAEPYRRSEGRSAAARSHGADRPAGASGAAAATSARGAVLGSAAAVAVVVLLVLGRLLAPAAARCRAGAGCSSSTATGSTCPRAGSTPAGCPSGAAVLLTPLAAPDGSDLIAVERTPLGYDAGAEPERARAELRAEFDAAVAAGSALSGYDPASRGTPGARSRPTGSEERGRHRRRLVRACSTATPSSASAAGTPRPATAAVAGGLRASSWRPSARDVRSLGGRAA